MQELKYTFLHFFMCMHSTVAGITVGLEDTAYSVLENAEMVEICAVLLQGALERETNITLSTMDGSATGTVMIVVASSDY